MNINPVKMEISECLRIAAIVMGILCVVAATIMMYHGEMILIGNMSVTASLVFLIAGLVLIIVSLIGGSRQKGQQISIRVWHIVLLVLIVLLVVYFSTRYSLEENDKYTVLVDLVLIMLALTGMIGYGTYRWISRGVSERTALAMKEGQSFTNAHVEGYLGFWYYEQYQAEIERKKEMDIIWQELAKGQFNQKNRKDSKIVDGVDSTGIVYLKHAIVGTTKALEFMKDLTDDKYERSICIYKNNLAYYLAEKKRRSGHIDEGEKKLAVEYAIFIWERIQKYPDRKAAWVDTYEFVTRQFPSKPS